MTRNPRNFCLLNFGVLGFGIRNSAQGILNPANDWSPESKFHWKKNAESSSLNPIHGVESRIQVRLRFPYMGWYGARLHLRYCYLSVGQWRGGGGGGAVQPMSTFDTTLLKHQKSSQPFEKGLLSPQVNGFDVTDVPQQMFFDLLRAAEKVAKIQILKIPVSKVWCSCCCCCLFVDFSSLTFRSRGIS